MNIWLIDQFLCPHHILPIGDNFCPRGLPTLVMISVNSNSLREDLCKLIRRGDLILLSIFRSITFFFYCARSQPMSVLFCVISVGDVHDGLARRQMVCVSFLEKSMRNWNRFLSQKKKRKLRTEIQRQMTTDRLTRRKRKTETKTERYKMERKTQEMTV